MADSDSESTQFDDIIEYAAPPVGLGGASAQHNTGISSMGRTLGQRAARQPLPWEVGLMGVIFGHRPLLPVFDIPPPGAPVPLPLELLTAQVAAAIPGLPPVEVPPVGTSAAVRIAKRPRLVGAGPVANDSAVRALAISAWASLVVDMGDSCTLFRQIAGEVDPGPSLEAAFAGKPASTLVKRASSLRLYQAWAAVSIPRAYPVTEAHASGYPAPPGIEGCSDQSGWVQGGAELC